MPIPRTRDELIDRVRTTHDKLAADLARVDDPQRHCVDDWSIRDLIAVRVWWTEAVLGWIESDGEPAIPAEGYGWKETPRLNADIVAASDEAWESLVARLAHGVQRVFATIDALDDETLLEVGQVGWAGKWPLSRWISINTATQYASARTRIRKVL